MATSTGPQKADFSKCELDSESKPKQSEYGGNTPKTAPGAKPLPLPSGETNSEGQPKA
jgi:hypothetical protein